MADIQKQNRAYTAISGGSGIVQPIWRCFGQSNPLPNNKGGRIPCFCRLAVIAQGANRNCRFPTCKQVFVFSQCNPLGYWLMVTSWQASPVTNQPMRVIPNRQCRNQVLQSQNETSSFPHPRRRWCNKFIGWAFPMDAPQCRNDNAANHGWQDTAEHCWCWPA